MNFFVQSGALGGTPPVGFKRETIDLGRRDNGERHLAAKWVPDPETWDICKKAWLMRASGCTYREIHEATHLYSASSSYAGMFRKRIYLGEMKFGDVITSDYAPAMVDQFTWDKVQSYNRGNKNKNNPKGEDQNHSGRINGEKDNLLSGLAYCHCGHLMNAYTIKPTQYDYYRCSRWADDRHDHVGNVPRQALDTAIMEVLIEKIINRRSLMLLSSHYRKIS